MRSKDLKDSSLPSQIRTMPTAGLCLGDTSGTKTPAQNLSSRDSFERFLIRVSIRSRRREVEELKRPVEHWGRKQLPWGMSQSCTFSYKCVCQPKTIWTKLSSKAGTAQIPVPGLCGVHTSGTAERTETSLETLEDEKAGEGMRKGLCFHWNMEKKCFSFLTIIH